MDKAIDVILSQMVFDIPSIIGMSVLLIAFFIQIYFYLYYYKKPISFYSNNKEQAINTHIGKPSVSVIIVAKNESENLEKNLSSILEQDYPNFEIIVVNDGSTDESQNYLELLSKKDNRLYSTFLPSSEDKEGDRRRIICLTIGIKAAKNDILLFTEAGASPSTKGWISSMVKHIHNEKEIVLGYSNLIAPNSFWGKVCRFDNLLFTLQYYSMAIIHKPFIGTYTNIAYRKELFFDNKGFSKALNFEYADEVFLNQIMTTENTAVALDQDSFVKINIENYSHWKTLKRVYCRSKKYFKKQTAMRFNFETYSRYLLYVLTLLLLVYTIGNKLWIYLIGTIILFSLRNLIQTSILKKAFEHFNIKRLNIALPFIELLQPLYLLNFGKEKNLNSKRRNRRQK